MLMQSRDVYGPLLAVNDLPERIERGAQIQPRIGSDAGRRVLGVHRVRAGILRNDIQFIGGSVPLLPEPEHPVDEAVMEVEDGIESGCAVFAHVAVGAVDR